VRQYHNWFSIRQLNNSIIFQFYLNLILISKNNSLHVLEIFILWRYGLFEMTDSISVLLITWRRVVVVSTRVEHWTAGGHEATYTYCTYTCYSLTILHPSQSYCSSRTLLSQPHRRREYLDVTITNKHSG
jgi:hypothetical protein